MSGIAKPGLIFAGATAPFNATPFPVDDFSSIEKLDIPVGGQNFTAQYLLVLISGRGTAKQTYKIPFATSTLRNFAYTTGNAAIAATIAAS